MPSSDWLPYVVSLITGLPGLVSAILLFRNNPLTRRSLDADADSKSVDAFGKLLTVFETTTSKYLKDATELIQLRAEFAVLKQQQIDLANGYNLQKTELEAERTLRLKAERKVEELEQKVHDLEDEVSRLKSSK